MTITQKTLCVLEEGQKAKPGFDKVIEVGKQIKISSQILDALKNDRYKPVHFDLLLLCGAIEFADRTWARPVSWSRSFHVTLPVHELELWQNQLIISKLRELLRHLTCDTWVFNFVQAKAEVLYGQKKIAIPGKKTFAVAYSDGLDSWAVSALTGPADEALRIRVAKTYQKAKVGEGLFSQLQFEVLEEKRRESSCRTRAFQFAAITAIAAHIANFSRIVVPESGQGALSPVMVSLQHVYPDFRNYPTFFRQMESFIQSLLKHNVVFEQRQIWVTKGHTLKSYLALEGKKKDDLIETHSCWRKRDVVNKDGRIWQCGICAACILRRLSLFTAGVQEPPNKYIIEDLTCSSDIDAMKHVKPAERVELMRADGLAGARHFENFGKLRLKDRKDLRVYSSELARSLDLCESEVFDKIINLCTAHAEEWNAFIAAQGSKSFLHGWIKGGG